MTRLIFPLIRREISARYRGSVLGIFWSLLTPLFMLGVYTFVFGGIFRARWTGGDASMAEFAVILFAGLVVFQFFAEVIIKAPGIILANQNYVKKIVFPLEILVPVAVGTALFQTIVSFAVLFGFVFYTKGFIPITALLLPIPLASFTLMILGLAWFLASLGTFLRDISQILGTVVTALMFLSAIFFPLSALPESIQSYIYLNPIALPVEQIRNITVFGNSLDWIPLGIYSCVALIVALMGYGWFQKTRKGFADVL